MTTTASIDFRPDQADTYKQAALTVLDDVKAGEELAVGWKISSITGQTHGGYRWHLVHHGHSTPILHEASNWSDANHGACPDREGDGLCLIPGNGKIGEASSGGVPLGRSIGHVLVYPRRLARGGLAGKVRVPWVVQVDTFDPIANLSDANLRDANLSDANLRDANLSDANLRGAYLRDAYLRGANLAGANLAGANLRDANLSDANLRDANLSDANLRGAYLRDANLAGANLSDANLAGANLRDANLSDANLRGANLRDANLAGANLSDANLAGANLSDANLAGAFGNQHTVLPAGWKVGESGLIVRV